MAERVVDHLETVEIEEQHRYLGAPNRQAGQRGLQLAQERRSVRQHRERIVRGLVFELLDGVLAFGEVPQHHQDGFDLIVA